MYCFFGKLFCPKQKKYVSSTFSPRHQLFAALLSTGPAIPSIYSPLTFFSTAPALLNTCSYKYQDFPQRLFP